MTPTVPLQMGQPCFALASLFHSKVEPAPNLNDGGGAWTNQNNQS